MILEPKKLRDLEFKQNKMVENLNKHKRMIRIYKHRLPKIAEQIDNLRAKQVTIST